MDEFSPEIYGYGSSINNKNDFYDDNNEYTRFMSETLFDLWENCIFETLKSIYKPLFKAFMVNFLFGIVTTFFGISSNLFHFLSASCGLYLLFATIQTIKGLLIILSSFYVPYLLIIIYNYYNNNNIITKKKQKNLKVSNNKFASFTQYIIIILFVSFEYVLLEKAIWLEIRGILMIFAMKLISIIMDNPLTEFPSFLEYSGYMLNSANILFGPWITYAHYKLQVNFPTKKNYLWIIGIIKSITLSLTFLTISNCWTNYFIPDDSNSLLVGYKEALSFRSSHYFISYLSETLMLAAGFKDKPYHFDQYYWKCSVTNFRKIEFPTALPIVATEWNKPMHEFLKKYVYRKWLSSGKFIAIIFTFLVSSSFHGFELKISTVLISLGFFSYLQISVREQISLTFNICAKVFPCKFCQHYYKRNSIMCRLVLIGFSIFTILHLIFLGILMDESINVFDIYYKWNNLYFYSLWIMFINFLIVK